MDVLAVDAKHQHWTKQNYRKKNCMAEVLNPECKDCSGDGDRDQWVE